ncbi:CDGSH iron-sulfur domain-containing protein [Gordonibacter sp.]|uniref:CDGSH iron-sulfur domain-containing protein n=1 Tax=Gordonibacter sp. TaxID=1968902 RepID=UPI003FA54318
MAEELTRAQRFHHLCATTATKPRRKRKCRSEAIVPADTHLEYREVRVFPAEQSYAFCRCGESDNKPFCDTLHVSIGFGRTSRD